MTAKTTPDRCPYCGSENLFSGHFDADDYAYPLNIGDHQPEGVRWTTFCNQCGSEVLPVRASRDLDEFKRLLRNAEGQLRRRDNGSLTGRNDRGSQDALLYKAKRMNRLVVESDEVGAALDNNEKLAARYRWVERRAYGLPV